MRFSSQDPDIETIVRRIKDGDYDLQPDFQRGEVWSVQKKRRLIDSVLRGWHVPPVHLVVREDGRSDVLDGQQRLTAIKDFVGGRFSVDGKIEPTDSRIAELDGMRYDELPEPIARAFRKFTVRVFELLDYSPDEPYELFFRLNQPTSLTEAEKRNAFIGEARNQVRVLTDWAEKHNLLSDRLGFSNARMAYDDLLARVLLTIEQRRLVEKVTASRVTARYRDDRPFQTVDLEAIRSALILVLGDEELPYLAHPPRPNKATLHTWLCIGAQIALSSPPDADARLALRRTISVLERERWNASRAGNAMGPDSSALISIFQDRSTARVADVSSVVLRDLIAWMMLSRLSDSSASLKARTASTAWHLVANSEDLEQSLLDFSIESHWGDIGWD